MDAATGVPYYHSVKLRRTSWTKPAGWDEGTARQCKESRPKPHVLQRCGDWVCAVDADSGAPYFVNRRTKQARWDPPPEWPTSSSPLAEEEAPAQLRICPMKAQASNTVGPLTPIFRPREADNLPPSVSDPALSARRPSSLLAAATPPTSRASTLVFPSLAFLPRPPRCVVHVALFVMVLDFLRSRAQLEPRCRFQGAEKHFRSQKSDTVVQGCVSLCECCHARCDFVPSSWCQWKCSVCVVAQAPGEEGSRVCSFLCEEESVEGGVLRPGCECSVPVPP